MIAGVYLLMDPRSGDVKYVGQSIDVKARVKWHWGGLSTSTGKWVAELKSLGMRPFWDVVEEADQARRDVLERELISKYAVTVLNIASGGKAGFTYLRSIRRGNCPPREPPGVVKTEEEFRAYCRRGLISSGVPAEQQEEVIGRMVSMWLKSHPKL